MQINYDQVETTCIYVDLPTTPVKSKLKASQEKEKKNSTKESRKGDKMIKFINENNIHPWGIKHGK